MQLARLVAGLGIVLAGTALDAQGEALLVSGSNVNVRAGPSAEAGILTRVGANEPAFEKRRQGEWVEVELPGQDVLGWIHDSLLITAPDPAAAPPQSGFAEVAAVDPGASDAAAGDAPKVELSDPSPLSRFRSEVAHFNDRAVAAAGVDLFTGVAPLGEDGVQVVTTEAWATMPEPGQRSYLNALYGRWQAAAGTDRALRLEIIDADGALMMEASGP